MKDINAQMRRVDMLCDMLGENVQVLCKHNGTAFLGGAGYGYPKNHNASKTAILNQITTLRNELLVLAEKIKQ